MSLSVQGDHPTCLKILLAFSEAWFCASCICRKSSFLLADYFKAVIVLLLGGLVLMHWLEMLWSRLVVHNIDGIGMEVQERIRGRFLVWSWLISRGGGLVMATCWYFARLMMELDTFAIRIRKGLSEKTFMIPWAATHGYCCRAAETNRLVQLRSRFCWLRQVVWTSAVASWVSP